MPARTRRPATPCADQQVDAFARVRGVGAQVHPERRGRAPAGLPDRGAPARRRTASRRPGCRARRRWPWPRSAAGRRPSPCRSARSGTGSRTGRRCGVCSAIITATSAARVSRRVDDRADQVELGGGRQRGCAARRPAPPARSRSRPDTSSTVTPGCTETSRIRWSGVSKSNTPEVADDPAQVVVPARGRAGRGGPVVPDAADHVDRARRTSAARAGAPSSWSGGSRCCRARRARRASCARGRAVVADRGDVHVAVAVDLARPHHHVPAAGPEHVEHGPVRDPALDDRRLVADGPGALGEVAPRRRTAAGRARRWPGPAGRRSSGSSPIGLARISPSPRHASAQATTQTSARAVGSSRHADTRSRAVDGAW